MNAALRDRRLERGHPPSAIRYSFFAFLYVLIATFPASGHRDPFWPIGYEPPKPESAEPEPEPVKPPPAAVKPPDPPKPKPPPVVPITEKEWAVARATLKVNGFTQAKLPDASETRAWVMINRISYQVGDTLNVTNQQVHYVWAIESLADQTLKLKQIRATRLPANGVTPPSQ